ncbi:unnamed protein product [Periconia digitata]|uniref:Peptidase C15, pyroglutamyl peptidase I-like protein n=1 Tax=Periconia digitata TaxID=1303443 RepID=A0A9W4UM93_9PLEO|nr:unnamed protein product [Periconia digitata]
MYRPLRTPFLTLLPRNSSWEIASQLPALLPATESNPTPIHIHVHYEPIRVAYQTVIDLVPKLLPADPSSPKPSQPPWQPDIILHIGLAASRPCYTLEQGSYSLGYGQLNDVDGNLFPDSKAKHKFPSTQFPARLETSFDTTDVLKRWREGIEGDEQIELPTVVQPSNDAGNFMCGFIYYNSLAHYYSINKAERPVVFLHVPDLTSSEKELENGKRVAIHLIQALVASRKESGVVDETMKIEKSSSGSADVDAAKNRTDVNFA